MMFLRSVSNLVIFLLEDQDVDSFQVKDGELYHLPEYKVTMSSYLVLVSVWVRAAATNVAVDAGAGDVAGDAAGDARGVSAGVWFNILSKGLVFCLC